MIVEWGTAHGSASSNLGGGEKDGEGISILDACIVEEEGFAGVDHDGPDDHGSSISTVRTCIKWNKKVKKSKKMWYICNKLGRLRDSWIHLPTSGLKLT